VVDDDADLVDFEIKEPKCFYGFKPFVHQVEESIVTFGPIFQLGCLKACSGVTRFISS